MWVKQNLFSTLLYTLTLKKDGARMITLLPQAFPKILAKYNQLRKKLPYGLLEDFIKARVATFSKNWKKKKKTRHFNIRRS